jgi:hypothetical protein
MLIAKMRQCEILTASKELSEIGVRALALWSGQPPELCRFPFTGFLKWRVDPLHDGGKEKL